LLREFIASHRNVVLARARVRVSTRNAPLATEEELSNGLPAFLDQLGEALRKAESQQELDHADIQQSASQHGDELFRQGLTVEQVVHDYGDLCQVITGLAMEETADIGAHDFQILNLCLDDAIAGAVTSYAAKRERAISDGGTERLGMLAHEMRNILNAAVLSFASIRSGVVAPGGSTGAVHERSLTRLTVLIDRSLAEVRLDAGIQTLERVPVWEIFEDVVMGAVVLAQSRGLNLAVDAVDHGLIVEADRQILSAALANLVQNAFKFTRPGSTVSLRATTTPHRILLEVEDECGGLPEGDVVNLLRPFVQKGHDRTGVGLGLSICLKAVKAIAGELRIRDLPGKGCVFTIDLAKQPAPPPSLFGRPKKAGAGDGSSGGSLARAG
jgi:signal transduction histidine kinase